ncbi:hypothetical protein [Idiomarina xiamenensis]|uniref:Uncharacterized protein n=1 Tax=Idiomarina xiamenensis 10-D-4 TaxID=740709 RepID=K2J689_9GAMM|nr:hypothetical protein [Idiomarina xiamenensis]EKE78576.1 hypothetical protein A10D4_13351 [Idiomarina xiamenensis 10-D-4]
MLQQLSILSPEQDVQQLREAGFSQPQPFYQGLVVRGWLAFAD